MSDEERDYLYKEIDKFNIKLPLIINVCDYDVDDDGFLIGKLSLVNMLWDKVLCKKVLIRNEYGIVGNLLYKYRDKLDNEVLLYLLDKDLDSFINFEYIDLDKYREEKKKMLDNNDKPFIVVDGIYCYFSYYDEGNYDSLSNNRQFIVAALDEGIDVFDKISDELKNDKELALKAVKQNGEALEYVSEELRNDKEVVMEAVKQNGEVFKYASEELMNDKDIILIFVNKCKIRLRDLYDECGFNGMIDSFWAYEDRDIVFSCIKNNINDIKYVSDVLLNDRNFILKIVKSNGGILELLSDGYKDDKEIVKLAVNVDGYYLKYASDRLRNDKEIVMEAINNNIDAIYFIGDDLLFDEDIIILINKIKDKFNDDFVSINNTLSNWLSDFYKRLCITEDYNITI